MTKKPLSVFVSCGDPFTPRQEEFISAIRSYLWEKGCRPITIGQDLFTIRQPVEAARDIIGSCDGAIVIAFERLRILKAIDKPGSQSPKPKRDEAHPTVWNQLEAALAYGQHLPLLILIDKGVTRQAMLSDRLEWAGIETFLDSSILRTARFEQIFTEWLSHISKRNSEIKDPSNSIDTEKISISQFILMLNIRSFVYIISVTFSILAATCYTSYRIGQTFPIISGQR